MEFGFAAWPFNVCLLVNSQKSDQTADTVGVEKLLHYVIPIEDIWSTDTLLLQSIFVYARLFGILHHICHPPQDPGLGLWEEPTDSWVCLYFQVESRLLCSLRHRDWLHPAYVLASKSDRWGFLFCRLLLASCLLAWLLPHKVISLSLRCISQLGALSIIGRIGQSHFKLDCWVLLSSSLPGMR